LPIFKRRRRRRRERRIKRSALRRERGSFLSVSGLFCFYLTDPGNECWEYYTLSQQKLIYYIIVVL